jgi:hypothetical protein
MIEYILYLRLCLQVVFTSKYNLGIQRQKNKWE